LGIQLTGCDGILFLDFHSRQTNLCEMHIQNQGCHNILLTAGATGTGCIFQPYDINGGSLKSGQGRVIFQEPGAGAVYNVALLNNPTLSIKHGQPPGFYGKGEQVSSETGLGNLSAFPTAASNNPPSVSYSADRVALTIGTGIPPVGVADLTTDAVDPTIVHSNSRPFVAADAANGGIWLAVSNQSANPPWTNPGAFRVTSILSGGRAKLNAAPGQINATGGKWITGASNGIATGTDGVITNPNTTAPMISSATRSFNKGDTLYLRDPRIRSNRSGPNGGGIYYVIAASGGRGTLHAQCSNSVGPLNNVTWGVFNTFSGRISVLGGKGVTQDAIITGVTGDVSNITYFVDRPWNVIPDTTSVVNIMQDASRVINYNNGQEGNYIALTDPLGNSNGSGPFFSGCSDIITDTGPSGYLRGFQYAVRDGFTGFFLRQGSTIQDLTALCDIPCFFNLYQVANVSSCRIGVDVIGGNSLDPGGEVAYFGCRVRNMRTSKIIDKHISFNGPSAPAGYFTIEGCTCSDATNGIYENDATSSSYATSRYILVGNNFQVGTATGTTHGIRRTFPKMFTIPDMPPYHQFHGYQKNSN
jgi:hypothetical protein